MDIVTPEHRQCQHCQTALLSTVRFCHNCGNRQGEDEEDVERKWITIKQLALFYGIEVLICALFSLTDFTKTVPLLLITDVLFAVLGITFFALNWHQNKALLRWPNFSLSLLSLYCAIAFSASLIVHYTSTWLNHTVFSKDVYYYLFFIGSKYSKTLMIFFIAVTPALFEELSYRGYVLQSLLKVCDTRQAVFLSAFMFAAVHLSLLSLFWLVPFALLLGYVRIKEKSIWYGVAIHFCFNLTACLLEIL